MSSFKTANESSSSSSSSSASSLQSKSKYVMLYANDSINDKELLKLNKYMNVRIFNSKFDCARTFNELMLTCDLILIDLSDESAKTWYNQYAEQVKNGGENLIVIYKYQQKTSISDIEKKRIKESYFADYIIKYLPKKSQDKIDFITRLCNDHIPKIAKPIITKLIEWINPCGKKE